MEAGCSSSITKKRNHDTHFYANACNVCKKYGIQLFECARCKMVAYCCYKHELDDIEHQEICETIESLITEGRDILPKELNIRAHFRDTENWNKRRKDIYALVQSRMTRPLRIGEKEMLLFPKSCIECHQQGKFLHSCIGCPNISFCETHVRTNAHRQYHCNFFFRCFAVDKLDRLPLTNYFQYLPTPLPYDRNIKENGCLNFFRSYIQPFLEGKADDILLAIHGQYITRPLTLFHAAKQINFDFNRDELFVQIIDFDINRENVMDTWEVLFHYAPTLKFINIRIIVQTLTDIFFPNHKLCPTCTSSGKKLEITPWKTIYYEYRMNTLDSKRPHLVVAYNPRIHVLKMNKADILQHERYAAWKVIIRLLLQYSNCPLILTSYTQNEAKKDVEEINYIAKKWIMREVIGKWNPFVSLRPYRDPETELPIFENSVLTIYKNPTL